ncbi:hypothetical protein D3C81_1555290 [compost metagenome]
MIADRHRGDALTYRLDDRATFMAQNRREDTFRVGTREGIGVSVANTAGYHAQQDFASLGHGHVHFDDFQRFLGLEGYSGTGLDHQRSPDKGSVQTCSVIQLVLMNNRDEDKTLLPYRDNQ